MTLSTSSLLEPTTDNGHTITIESPITLHITPSHLETAYLETAHPETSSSNSSDIEASDIGDSEDIEPFTAIAQQLVLVADTHDLASENQTDSNKTSFQACYLLLSISLAQYQQVLDQSLFHLKPEIRGPLHETSFEPDQPILLELGLDTHQLAALQPSLNRLANQFPQGDRSHDGLQDQPQKQLKALLTEITSLPKQTHCWRCRAVRQQRADGETIGYQTLWAYTTPAEVEPIIDSGSEAVEAIASMFEKTMTVLKTEVEQDLPIVKQHLSKVSDHLAAALEHVDWDAALSDISSEENDLESEAQNPRQISDCVKQFFNQDDWAYVHLPSLETPPSDTPSEISSEIPSKNRPNTTVLQLAFQGESGRWTCLAHCENQAKQVIFYSISPISAPTERCAEIAELLTRANDSLIIGNFELTFETGEIRYKTSLDVEGDRLTPALVRSLVYANVQTLDIYLPSILAVLENRATPIEAIQLVESNGQQESKQESKPAD